MVATPRSRSLDQDLEKGYVTFGGTVYSRSRFNDEKMMNDVIGDFGGSHTLYARQIKRRGSLYQEYDSGGNLIWDFPLPLPPHANSFSGSPSPSTFVTTVLSQGGPENPTANLPLFVYELGDIPRMLRHAGNLLGKGVGLVAPDPSIRGASREIASAIISYQFGWAPLIQDITKMIGLAEAIDRRQRELEKLKERKGLRRKLKLWEGSATTQGSEILSTVYGRYIEQDYISNKRRKMWGTVRWKPRFPWLWRKNPSWIDAFRSVTGTNASMIPITVWKALPWSWAIDWFTNASNVFLATRNIVLYKPSLVCIMRETSGDAFYMEKKYTNKRFITPGHIRTRYMERFVYNPTIDATLRVPFMDPFRLSVLGSLSVLAITGRR